jgi:hypothetical protein
MTSTLGTTSADAPLLIDLERLIGSHACIVANAGGGKSGAIRRLLEATHGRIQHIVLDVEDEFYSLRERYDYVIAGGDGGDIPAPVESAAALARAALDHSFSLIVQLNDLGPDGAPRFVGRFLDSLISAPRDLWRPVLVVLDEAQRFAPSGGERTEATHGVRALTGQGRKRGFTAILASQRIAKIDPNVRGDVNNWLLGRVGQAIDRNTMADALGFTGKEGRERFPGLAPRRFWAFGPALADEPVLITVADVETTPVRPGQAKVPTPPPPEALREILQGLAAPVAEEADAAKNIPGNIPGQGSDSSAEVERLTRELSDLRGQFAFRGEVLGRAQARAAKLDARLAAVRAILDEPLDIPAQGGGGSAVEAGRTEAVAPAPPRAKPQRQRAEPQGVIAEEAATGLAPRHQRILNSVAWCATFLGRTGAPRGIVAWVADISSKSSSYSNDLGALRTRGLIDYPASGEIALTELGSAVAEWPATPPTRQALKAAVAEQLAPRQARFLDTLWAESPLARDDLAERCGVSPQSSSYSNDLGRLRTLGVIDYPRSGWVALGSIFGDRG